MTTKNDVPIYKFISGLALSVGLLLLIPLIAMQFSDEVVWTLSDFIIAGTFLFGTGLTYKLITRKSGNVTYRIAIGFALFTWLFLLWVNGAVGIIGSENNPINLLYFGVIAVGIIGAIIARFQSNGLIYTMFAMAIAQALIAVVAILGGYHPNTESAIFEIITVNGFFIMLFIISALIFRFDVIKPLDTLEPQ
tara:strand:- start:88761 stop:89339 length:579 start_codon:yes stop_codon:yes gene_type:complete